MKILHCKNIKDHRDDMLEIKSIDSTFNYKFEGEELFFLRSYMGKKKWYAIIKINNIKPLIFKNYIIKKKNPLLTKISKIKRRR